MNFSSAAPIHVAARAFTALLVVTFSSSPGSAQTSVTDPATRIPQDQYILPEMQPGTKGKGEKLFKLPTLPPERIPDGTVLSPLFRLKRVDLIGNTVLSRAELEPAIAPFLNNPVGTAELEDLRLALTRAYVELGYINSGAVLPNQRIENGRVVFRIVEGRLSAIRIAEGSRYQDGFIRDRLRRGAGPPLNISELEQQLRLVHLEPGVSHIRANLAPGPQPGESILDAKVVDASPVRLKPSVSNTQSPDVGAERAELSTVVENLTGWGETVGLTIGFTEGVSDIDGYLSVPLNVYDTRLTISAGISEADILEEEFRGLDIKSRVREAAIELRQPVFRTPNRNLSVFSKLDVKHSRSLLLGEGFSFDPSLDNGDARLSMIRVGSEWIDQGDVDVLALRTSLTAGIDWLGSTDQGVEPNDRFLKWQVEGQYVRRVLEDSELVLRGQVQLTDSALFAVERMSIGGMNTVRGYRENLLVRDNGVVASAEFRVPVYRAFGIDLFDGADELVILAGPFVDFGRGWNTDRETGSPGSILGLGVGLTARLGERFTAQLYLGRALREVEQSEYDVQDDGIHFRVTATFF
jgi:hemolysin activation/secretion protein